MNPTATLRSLRSFTGRARALHLSWMAFLATFLVWFDFAPFATTIAHHFHLSRGQTTTLSLCNLGLTVPARMLIGIALDRFGARRVYPAILWFAAITNAVFALAGSFAVLVISRLALSIVGAGFVVGIRMVAEWWPRQELGTAEGIYGGWGNFGAGAATVGLPLLADAVGGTSGWRWAIGAMSVVAAVWGVVYLRLARDTPSGGTWKRPLRQGALEVTTRGSVFGLIALTFPVVGILGLVAYRIELVHVISRTTLLGILTGLVVLAGAQVAQIVRVNRPALANAYPAHERYSLRPLAACCLAYAVCFGGELAVLSVLPTFFGQTWHLGVASAGVAAGTFGVMNLVTRPSGGVLSDRSGRRRETLVLALLGTALGFGAMSLLQGRWPIGAVVVLTVAASAFLQGGSGATFAVVPQIKAQVGGQLAGLTGAYGNLGGILWLYLLVYVTPQRFFLALAGAGIAAGAVALRLLPADTPSPLTITSSPGVARPEPAPAG
jgi:NNP family nitrate/nitrite transporter-like MFS transporter